MATQPTVGGTLWGAEQNAFTGTSLDPATGKIKNEALQVASTAPIADAAVANKKYVDDQKSEVLGSSTNLDSDTNEFLYAHAYSAPTDGYVTAWDETGGTVLANGFVGGTTNPAGAGTKVAANRVATSGHWTFISFFVPKGQFWEVTTTGGNDGNATIRWQSFGTLSNPVDQD